MFGKGVLNLVLQSRTTRVWNIPRLRLHAGNFATSTGTPRRRFTQADDETIRNLFEDECRSWPYIASVLDRSLSSVYCRYFRNVKPRDDGNGCISGQGQTPAKDARRTHSKKQNYGQKFARYSPAEIGLIASRLRQGCPVPEIAESLGRTCEALMSTIQAHEQLREWKRPPRRQWTLEEDGTINASMIAGTPFPHVAKQLGRHRSSVWTRARFLMREDACIGRTDVTGDATTEKSLPYKKHRTSVHPRPKSRNDWSTEAERLLLANVVPGERIDYEELAKLFPDRSLRAVRAKCRRLLPRDQSQRYGYAPPALAQP